MVESGEFYNTFIDPVLTKMRKRVAQNVTPGLKIIDVACGTGAQVFELASKSESVMGVDLSESMIKKAFQLKYKNNVGNADFKVCDATNLSDFYNGQFDYAILSLALHQFSTELHSSILNEMKRIADKILIVDYAVPLPKNIAGYGSKIAEFIAGIDHNRNFKAYYNSGGLNSILPQNNLKITHSEHFAKGAFQLVVCTFKG
ncbi:MAG: class I SAM-dependent methyltransferase [Prolixibacteraceae bacterium]|nr:class I SAM-dependent methyltransferase [Prolixibacteraceae bacterium]